jgi:hypothetical protein
MTTRETQDRRLEDLLKRQLSQLLTPMVNPAITDILINQDGSVWYEETGRGLYRDEGLHLGDLVRESIIGTSPQCWASSLIVSIRLSKAN